MRSGGGAGVAAAQEFFQLARGGAVSPGELREAQKVVLATPELRDSFEAVARELGATLGAGAEQVFRDVRALRPDTSKLANPRALPERFLSDLKLVEHELLQHPGLKADQKAERLFDFFAPYAERFVELKQPLSDAELQRALAQFDKALVRAGFDQLRAGDGRAGHEAAREMLEAKTVDAQARARPSDLQAPGWRDNAPAERALRAELDSNRQAVATLEGKSLAQPQLHAQAPRRQQGAPEEERAGGRRKDKPRPGVLGSQMLWNVMHLLRGEELDDVARRDARNALAVSAALLLILGGVVVGVMALV